MKNINFTEYDRAILQSYDSFVEGLADYLGDASEIVLHSLEDYQNTVIKIANGHHAGRELGVPITNMALQMLSEIKHSNAKQGISYFTKSKNNRSMKSSMIAIRGEAGKIIGFMCININLDESFSGFLQTFLPQADLETRAQDENFAPSIKDMILETIERTIEAVDASPDISYANRNKHIIGLLYDRGVFNMRDAVTIVANMLKITKHTVYLHLRSCSQKREGNL
ncbi:PAS domain-containing protein [Paenibacillus thiaminolyticus]|uniref:helix-turn-helix transcriptional regulator n=1 Tax=Paenibacillus thiaminolyticus TaxID=49283 RepID=UPI00232C0965|nr:PAS domain-containing protein [Paenibacillus thiaminolyticus]WCF09808.1 PAS domain-containing protein [Paenibacillus thiaminolyticus]